MRKICRLWHLRDIPKTQTMFACECCVGVCCLSIVRILCIILVCLCVCVLMRERERERAHLCLRALSKPVLCISMRGLEDYSLDGL